MQAVQSKPLVSKSTPEACDFADRLHAAAHDVKLVELAVEGLRDECNGPDEDVGAVVMACRRLYCELVMLADDVLPPLTAADRR